MVETLKNTGGRGTPAWTLYVFENATKSSPAAIEIKAIILVSYIVCMRYTRHAQCLSYYAIVSIIELTCCSTNW